MLAMKRTTGILLCCLTAGLARAEPVVTAPIPNRWMPQGEMRLFNGAGEARIEVLLHTRFLDRVLRAIAEKETENWGEHPDAQRYLAALSAARTSELVRTRGAARETLLIEFVDARTSGAVRVSAATVTDASPHMRVEGARVLAAFDPDPGYLRRNMALILTDQLGLTPEEAVERLQPPRPEAP